MKNLYLIPTDKPSKLFFNHIKRFEKYQFSKEPFINGFTYTSNYHVYITNDSDIKKGDWFIHSSHGTTNIYKAKSVVKESIITTCDNGCWIQFCRKIILSTDEDLIADDIQSIDDDFLQWFINNPSCVVVEVDSFCKYGDNCPSEGAYNKQHLCDVGYKIIIPEDPNPFELPNVLPDDVFNKSLEELAEKEYPKLIVENPSCNGYNELKHIDINEECRNAFMEGAKWQQKQMYREEEVENIIYKLFEDYASNYTNKALEEFENFKKK
jgi:hypothetical protein